MTGFRVALGGAQARYGVAPDLSTFGKIIGGGMPVGAYGGSRELMQQIAPSGPIYQAGTLSGNPVAMARSEEHTSELQSLMRISYAVFCLNKKKNNDKLNNQYT